MRDFGDKLAHGLKAWVDQGQCPPEVLARLEQAIRPRRARTWPVWTGVAAAAAAVAFLVWTVSSSPVDELDGVPLVGKLAATIAQATRSERVAIIPVSRGASLHGVAVVVDRLVIGPDSARVRYWIEGPNVDLNADPMKHQVRIETSSGPVKITKLMVEQEQGRLVFDATCERLPAGEPVTLTVAAVPSRADSDGLLEGPWQVTFQR